MRLGIIETRFAEMIWDNEPIASGKLVKMCAEEFEWKKPTTYTVLRRLCDRGLFRNEDGTVSSVVSKEEYYARQSEEFVKETFAGSLPAFLTAFTSRQRLSEEEIQELQELIDKSKK